MLDAEIKKSYKVVLGVCLICSFLVSTATVMLQPEQQQNRRHDRIGNILRVADLLGPDTDLEQTYRGHIQPVMIDLASGKRVDPARFDDILNIKHFDIKTLADHPVYGTAIPDELDIARIKRRPKFMVVYLDKTGRQFDKLILPVYGKGLWSTLYGFLALDSDLEHIAGITFYQHGETPGLGGEIDNPDWQRSWRGKQAFDSDGNVIIEVIRGEVDPASSSASHQIDGLSGATLTSRGVSNLVNYWLGKDGYAPLLSRLKRSLPGDLTTNDETG